MSQPKIINVANYLRDVDVKGNPNRRHNLRRAVRAGRNAGEHILLYARPGTIVNHQGGKALVTNKGKYLAI